MQKVPMTVSGAETLREELNRLKNLIDLVLLMPLQKQERMVI